MNHNPTLPYIAHAHDPNTHPRLIIIGSAAAGKSTLAVQFARLLSIRAIDLDDLHWLPDWAHHTREDFRARVNDATAQPHKGWAVAGNYSSCRDILWSRATTIIWLDYDFGVVMKRLLSRTARRWWTQERLFGGTNTEQLSKIFSKDSLIWYAITTWRRRKREYPLAFAQPEHAHLQIIHLTDPAQTERLLAAHSVA